MVDSEQSSRLSGDPDPSPLTSSTPSVHSIHRNSFHHHQEQVNHHSHHHEHPFGHLNQQLEERKQLQQDKEQEEHLHQHQLEYLTQTLGKVDHCNHSQVAQQGLNINDTSNSSNLPINQFSFPSSSSSTTSSFKFDSPSDSIQGCSALNGPHSKIEDDEDEDERNFQYQEETDLQTKRTHSATLNNSSSVIHMESEKLNDSYVHINVSTTSPPASTSSSTSSDGKRAEPSARTSTPSTTTTAAAATTTVTTIKESKLHPGKSKSKCNTSSSNEIDTCNGNRINITVNPLIEKTSNASKNLYTKIRKNFLVNQTNGGEDNSRDKERNCDSQDALSAKSLSIDSYYITPTTANPQRESVEKLIMATNIFVFCAFVAAIILAIVIIWLALGMLLFSMT